MHKSVAAIWTTGLCGLFNITTGVASANELSSQISKNLEALSNSQIRYNYNGLGISAKCAKVDGSPENILLCATPINRYNMFSQSYLAIYLEQRLMIVATSRTKSPCKGAPEITIFYTNQTPKDRFDWSQGVSFEGFSAKNDKFLRRISVGFNKVYGCTRGDSFSTVHNTKDPVFTRKARFNVWGYGGGSIPLEDLLSFAMPWDLKEFISQ